MATIEQVREYWDKRPCNIRHSVFPPGTYQWSTGVTQKKYKAEPHIPGFAQFHLWKGKQVLEVGCGIGTDLLQFVRAGARVYAVDASVASCDLARSRVEVKDMKKCTILPSNAEEWLPFVDGGFDLIYSFGVLHHTPNPEKILQNMHKRLKPTGQLRIMVYAKWSIKNLTGQQPEAQAGCPIVRTYTGRSIRRLLKENGFKVKSIRKTHIFPWRVKDYIEQRWVKEPYYSWMPDFLFHGLERVLGWHLLVTARKV